MKKIHLIKETRNLHKKFWKDTPTLPREKEATLKGRKSVQKKIDEKMTGVSEGGRTREDTEQQREEGGERKRDRQRCQSSLLQNASTAGERQDQISDNKIRTRHLSVFPSC